MMGFQCFLALIPFEIEYEMCFWIKSRLYLLVGECYLDERISVHADCHSDEQIFGYLLEPLLKSHPFITLTQVPRF